MEHSSAAGHDEARWLFAYGLLRDQATLERVLGAVPPSGGSALLGGYRRLASAEGYYYILPEADAPPVEGELWQVTAAELARLDAFEEVDPADPAGPLGVYRRIAVTVETPRGPQTCWVYVGGVIAGEPDDGTDAG